MTLIPIKDFRSRSAEVWRRVAQHNDVVVTNNGKPVAVMTSVTADSVDELLTSLQRVRALRALEAIHRQAVAQGSASLSDAAIAREIRAARRSRR